MVGPGWGLSKIPLDFKNVLQVGGLCDDSVLSGMILKSHDLFSHKSVVCAMTGG